MIVGLLRVELRIGDSQSLKEKRRVLKSLKERLRHSFNVSVAETGDQDLWQRAELGVACVGTDTTGVNRVLNLVVDAIEHERTIELMHYELEIL